MRAQSLDKALPAIAGFIADRTGIPVIRGSKAETDNRAIYLPRRCSELDISEKDLVESVAYLYHEAGHMLHSNFSLAASTPLQRAITGILEDIRIEHLVMGKFPAARRYLSRLTEIMLHEATEGRSGFPMLNGEESESVVLQRYILYRLRHDVLRQQSMQAVAQNALDVAHSKLPATMLTRLDALMYQVSDCASEDEVFQLSESIIEMIREEQKKEEERKQQQQSPPQQTGGEPSAQSESDEGEAGEGEGDQRGANASAESEPGAGEEDGSGNSASPESEPDEGEDSESTSRAGSTARSNQSEADPGNRSSQTAGSGRNDDDENAAEALGNILGMSENDVQEDIGEMLKAALNVSAAHDDSYTGASLPMPNHFKANIKASTFDLAALRGSINAVRTRTLQWMESIAEDDVAHSRSGMCIDPSRIWSARLGGAIFVRTDEGVDLNAAVSIVIDRSGSMSSTIGQAAQAAVATMLAFDVPGIKTQVTVFPWYQDGEEGVSIIKRWEESPRQLASRVSNLTTDGGTPMAEAVLFAASDIVRREESLKIIMIVTDGEPNDPQTTRHVIERARENDITVVALGIGVDPSRIFTEKYAAAINDVGQLSSSMVRLVKSAFEDRRAMP